MTQKDVNSAFIPTDLTGPPLRGARAMVGMSAKELAEAASVGMNTIGRAEACEGKTTLNAASARLLVTELQARGITFLVDRGVGPGVCFLRPT